MKKGKASGKLICEICKMPHILVEHHIKGRDIPNANHSSNTVLLCANCHNKIHYGNIIVEKWSMTSNGLMLIWHKNGEPSLTGDDSTPNLLVNNKI